MMNYFSPRMMILFFAVTLVGCSAVSAQATSNSDTAYREAANSLLKQSFINDEFIGAVAGFSKDGDIKWEYAAGYSDLERKIEFTTQTLTRIASVTKPMTAIAIMQLYEQGKIDLDKPIREYLPDFPEKKEGVITVRHLLNHSSGIDDYKNSREQENQVNYPDLKAVVNLFKDRNLIAEPGKEFHYSTYNYVLLGLIIEKITALGYGTYMQKNVWDKAGMIHTGIEDYAKEYTGYTKLYHKNTKGKIKKADPTNLSDRVPGGGVYSCITDMLKFGDAVLNHTLIKEETLNMMLKDPGLKKNGNAYGLGWFLYGVNPKYGNVYGHTGTQTGASTFLILLPEKHTTIVVLANTSGAMQTVSNITIKLFDITASTS